MTSTSVKRLARALLLVTVAAPIPLGACSSDDTDTPSTDVVVAGAPLAITNPSLVAGDDTDLVIGTIQNVTDRTIEITSSSSSVGDIEFRSADGSLLSTLTISPNSELTLESAGVHLELVEPTADDTVDVVLRLDIQDDFEFTADRVASQQ